MLLENIGMADEEALYSVDRVASLPFGFDLLNNGQQIVTNAGIEVDGFTMMPLDGSAAGSDPMFQKLAERGITDVGMDLKIASGVRLAGDSMTMFYGIEAAMRDLTEIRFKRRAVDGSSLLFAACADAVLARGQWRGSSRPVRRSLSRRCRDRPLMIAACWIFFLKSPPRRKVSVMVICGQWHAWSSLPHCRARSRRNAANLLPPIEALISQGGELQVLAQPGMPVPLSSSLGFMMLPDMAIQQLGITVTHMP